MHVDIAKGYSSHKVLFRKVFISQGHYSENLFYIPKGHYSEIGIMTLWNNDPSE